MPVLPSAIQDPDLDLVHRASSLVSFHDKKLGGTIDTRVRVRVRLLTGN